MKHLIDRAFPTLPVAVILLLALLLSGCGTTQSHAINTAYLSTIPEPDCKNETNQDILECLIKYKESLKQSNYDKQHVLQDR